MEALKEEEELWVEEEVTFRLAYEILKAESLEALDQLSDSVNWDFEDFIYIMDSNYGNFDFEAEKIQNAYAVEVQYNLIKEQVDWRGQVTFHAKLFEDTVIMLLYEYENQWYIYEDNIVTIFNLLDNITSSRVRGNFYEAYDAACERLLEN